MLTLNQNIEILKNFTSKHRSLNSYFHEGVNKLSLNNDTPIYPKFESILESLDTTNDIFSVKFKIFISDLVKKDNTNRDIVISDCSLIANDFLYYVRKIVRDGILPGFKCQKDIQLTDYVESGTDEESGIYFDFTMSGHVGNYSCNLPINSGNVLDNNYIYVGGQFTPITNNMSFITETFTYDGNPFTLSHTPLNILTLFLGASVLFETDDYTKAGNSITINSPIAENGDKIRITYTY